MNRIALFIKIQRNAAKLTQEEFAEHSGLGLRFIRDLEQGKETLRMDKVNQAPCNLRYGSRSGQKVG